MSREEEFQLRLQIAKEVARQGKLRLLPIKDWWEAVREEVVRPVLIDAVKALEALGYFGQQLSKNGTGLVLQAGPNDGTPRSNLTFTLGNQHVEVTSSAKDLDEIWDDRGYVTEENVASKVGLFLERIAGVHPARSVYEDRGLITL